MSVRETWSRLVGRPRSRRRLLIGTVSGFGAGFGLTLILSVAVLNFAGLGSVQLNTPARPQANPAAASDDSAADPNAGISEVQASSNPGAALDPTPTTEPPTPTDTPTPTPTTPKPTTPAPKPTTKPPAPKPTTPRPAPTTTPPTSTSTSTTDPADPTPTWTRGPGHHGPTHTHGN